jgi:AraC-like DNA-binding protein
MALVLIAGIPIISINVLNHALVKRIYTNELGVSYIGRLKITDTILKMWEDETQKQGFIISMNEYLNLQSFDILGSGKLPDYESINTINRLSSFLENIVSTSNKYYSISLFYQDSGFLISSVRELVGNKNSLDYSILEQSIEEGKNWATYDSTVLPGFRDRGAGQRLFYLIPFMKYVTRVKGLIIFEINEEELSNLINGGMEENGTRMLVIDNAGTVLSDINKTNIGKKLGEFSALERILKKPSGSGFFTALIEGIRYFTVFWRSGRNGWHYCSLVPMNELTRRTGIIYFITISMIIVFLLLAISFSYFSAKQLNRPVERLQYRLEDYKLIRMLTGVGEKEGDYLRTFGMPNSCCAVICLDAYTPLLEKHGAEYIDKCKNEIVRMCQAGLSLKMVCGGVALERNNVALIMNFETLDLPSILDKFRDIQAKTFSMYGFSLSVGIGKAYPISDVNLSYVSARKAISRRLIMGTGSLIPYQEENELARGYYYPNDREKIIFNNLKLNDSENTAMAMSAFCTELKIRSDLSVDNIIQVFNQLMGNIIKHLVDLRIDSGEIFDNEKNLYHQLTEFETIDEFEFFFKAVLQRIINFQLNNNIKKPEHITRILNYINANYDKKFDLNLLAESVGLSYSHVRRVFTEETGESILNYVYKMKVEAAKKLLRDARMPIVAIAAKLGFYNKQSFYRFFEKYEGITPNKYRELEQME